MLKQIYYFAVNTLLIIHLNIIRGASHLAPNTYHLYGSFIFHLCIHLNFLVYITVKTDNDKRIYH